MRRKVVFSMMVLTSLIVLNACIPGDGSYEGLKQANFLSGVWHGWIAPLSLIISLFDHDITIYEAYNKGWLYDFGFYIAIISGFGSLSLSRKHKKKKK